MITVKLGEAKPQEKPFPKLMIGSDGTIIEVLENPDNGFSPVVIRCSETFTPGYRKKFNVNGKNLYLTFTDYNEPITIQNA